MKVALIFTNPPDRVFVSAVRLGVNIGQAPRQVLLVPVVLSQPPWRWAGLDGPRSASLGAMWRHLLSAPVGFSPPAQTVGCQGMGH